MPSVFTIQGPDPSATKRLTEVKKPNTRDLDELCDIRAMLLRDFEKARGRRPERVARAYQTAADIVQHYIEDSPGGRNYFWSGRCGTKKQRR